MPHVVALPREGAGLRALASRWWPVDLLILGYLSVMGLFILAYRVRIPRAGWLLALHAAGFLLVALAARSDRLRPAGLICVFRHWYPLPYVAACYREMSILVPAIRGTDLDAQLARLDLALWGVHPTVWLERILTPWFTEFLQIIYALYLVAVLLVPVVLWRKRRLDEFRYYAFLTSLGYLSSFVGYFLVPARGPRFLLEHLQSLKLEGLWSFAAVRQALDFLESAHYDCFPSAHTELTLLACWSSRLISGNLFRLYSVYIMFVVFSTIYLRYHYTVDLLAGVLLALVLRVVTPYLYDGLRRGA